jgi:hypothetical protein
MNSPHILEKLKQTNKTRRGVYWSFHMPDFQEKSVRSKRVKWGVDHHMQSSEFQSKMKTHYQETFGVDNPFQADECKVKIRCTNKMRYGVEHPMYSQELKNKQHRSMKAKAQRPIVVEIKRILKENDMKLTKGWYQKSDEKLEVILSQLLEKIDVI